MTRIYDGRSGVPILAGATELSLHQNIETSSSAHPAYNASFFSGCKVARADSLTIHICLEPSFKTSGAIPPLNLSPSMAHIGTTSFYLNHLHMYKALNRSHLSGPIKETFIQFLLLTCTLHDQFLSSSLIQLH